MLENYRNGEFDDRIIRMHESLLNIAHHLNEDGYFVDDSTNLFRLDIFRQTLIEQIGCYMAMNCNMQDNNIGYVNFTFPDDLSNTIYTFYSFEDYNSYYAYEESEIGNLRRDKASTVLLTYLRENHNINPDLKLIL